MPKFYVTQHGAEMTGPFDTWFDALGSVLSLQPQSLDYARKYNGWDIAEIEGEDDDLRPTE